MNTNNLALPVVLAFVLGGISGYVLHGYTASHHGMHGMHERHSQADRGGLFTDNQPDDMPAMGHMMHMSVNSEREFIAGMIPHHQEAIDTAKEVLARGGTNAEIRSLAENIIRAQTEEIAAMKTWYETWYGEVYVDTGTYEPMMRDLSELSGAELDRTFLSDMVMHHMGAIMMARSVEPHIEHTEIAELAEAIITTQTAEIQLMKQLLQTL